MLGKTLPYASLQPGFIQMSIHPSSLVGQPEVTDLPFVVHPLWQDTRCSLSLVLSTERSGVLSTSPINPARGPPSGFDTPTLFRPAANVAGSRYPSAECGRRWL